MLADVRRRAAPLYGARNLDNLCPATGTQLRCEKAERSDDAAAAPTAPALAPMIVRWTRVIRYKTHNKNTTIRYRHVSVHPRSTTGHAKQLGTVRQLIPDSSKAEFGLCARKNISMAL